MHPRPPPQAGRDGSAATALMPQPSSAGGGVGVGGQARVQVCEGEGKMVVESEEEDGEEPDREERRDGDPGRAGAELGGSCALGGRGVGSWTIHMAPHCLSAPVITSNTRLSSFPPPYVSADPTAHGVLGIPAVFWPPAVSCLGKG